MCMHVRASSLSLSNQTSCAETRRTVIYSDKFAVFILFILFCFIYLFRHIFTSHRFVVHRDGARRHVVPSLKMKGMRKRASHISKTISFHVCAHTHTQHLSASTPTPPASPHLPACEAPPQEKIESRSLTLYDTGRVPSIFIETRAVDTEIAFDSPCLCLSPARLHLAAARASFKSWSFANKYGSFVAHREGLNNLRQN